MSYDRIVVWSGGYDSTWILYDELKRHKEISAWSFTLPGVSGLKMTCERLVRERFVSWISSAHKKFDIDYKVIDLVYDNLHVWPQGTYPQQLSWTIIASIFAPNNSTLIFGFHRGDQFFELHDRLYEASIKICKCMDKTISWEFPLQYVTKHQIIREVYQHDLNRFCWTCENPNALLEPCGVCESCWNNRVAVEECKMRGISLERVYEKDDTEKVVCDEKVQIERKVEDDGETEGKEEV